MWSVTRKLHLPVDVAPRSRSNSVLAFLVGLVLFMANSAHAEKSAHAEEKFLGQISAHSPAELASLLEKAERWSETNPNYPEDAISVILHGPEAAAFIKENYKDHQQLVDKAAKLDAFNVVDIKICETWMGINQVKRNQLPAFVDTVPFGPAEEKRLIKAGYQSF